MRVLHFPPVWILLLHTMVVGLPTKVHTKALGKVSWCLELSLFNVALKCMYLNCC